MKEEEFVSRVPSLHEQEGDFMMKRSRRRKKREEAQRRRKRERERETAGDDRSCFTRNQITKRIRQVFDSFEKNICSEYLLHDWLSNIHQNKSRTQ